MKRLLAAFAEPIFQISKAFRSGEAGSRHNPEFSLLEWYRPGFDHHQLMAEVADLAQYCLGPRPVNKYSYREIFQQCLQIDPFTATIAELEAVARRHVDPGGLTGDRDLWLDLLMSHVLEPQLAGEGVCFVYDYPASQAALAVLFRPTMYGSDSALSSMWTAWSWPMAIVSLLMPQSSVSASSGITSCAASVARLSAR